MDEPDAPSEMPNEEDVNRPERARRHGKRWTIGEDNELLTAWRGGDSWDELQKKFNRSDRSLRLRIGHLVTILRDQKREEGEEKVTTAASGSRKPPKDPWFDPKMSLPSSGHDPDHCVSCGQKLGQRCYACGIPL